MGSSFKVSMKGGDQLIKKLNKLDNGVDTAIEKTLKDFGTRAPAQVSKGIRQFYNVDTAAIKSAQTRVKITDRNVELEYKGRTLTPIHFNMSPASIDPKGRKAETDRIPGQKINFSGEAGQVAAVAQPKPYTIRMTIKKGHRVALGGDAYLQGAGGSGPVIPYQRKGEGRGPTHAVHTVSVPQMIDNDARPVIEEKISEMLEKRFNHYIDRLMK